MPRDILMLLVLVAVLLNLALLVGAGIARWRAGSASVRVAPDRDEAAKPVPAPHVLPPGSILPIRERTLPARSIPASRHMARPLAVAPPRGRPVPVSPAAAWPMPLSLRRDPTPQAVATRQPLPLPLPPVRPPFAPPDRPRAPAPASPPAPSPAIEVHVSVHEPGPVGGEPPVERVATDASNGHTNGHGDHDGNGRSGRGADTRGSPRGRSRRFVLPQDAEDRGRTERAIEAFLGEPAPSGAGSGHRPRRRSRRQRTGNEGEPLVLVAALRGYDDLRQALGGEGATRFAEAYGLALRATLRSGDHVTDIGQGRLRLVVHADEEGASALTERARAVVDPWLRLAPVPLALRVRPMPQQPAETASPGDRPAIPPPARTDGGPERRSVAAS